MLQEVPVVGGDFDHQTLTAEAEARFHRLHIAARMFHPTGRKRTEIGVFIREQLFVPQEILGLREPAFLAHQHAQRIMWLRFMQLRALQVRIGGRREAQVDELQLEIASAMPAKHRRILVKS